MQVIFASTSSWFAALGLFQANNIHEMILLGTFLLICKKISEINIIGIEIIGARIVLFLFLEGIQII